MTLNKTGFPDSSISNEEEFVTWCFFSVVGVGHGCVGCVGCVGWVGWVGRLVGFFGVLSLGCSVFGLWSLVFGLRSFWLLFSFSFSFSFLFVLVLGLWEVFFVKGQKGDE